MISLGASMGMGLDQDGEAISRRSMSGVEFNFHDDDTYGFDEDGHDISDEEEGNGFW